MSNHNQSTTAQNSNINNPGNVGTNNLEENLRIQQEALRIAEELEKFNKRINDGFKGYLEGKREMFELERKISEVINARAKLIAENVDVESDLIKELDRQTEIYKQQLADQRQMVKETSFLVLAFKDLQVYSLAAVGGAMSNMASFILDADKAWRELTLNMGLSGTRSEILRGNLQEASVYGAHLGSSFKDLAEIQGSYTEELGNAVLLNEQNLGYILQVGKGTAMGTVEAGKMAAKFNLIGKSVKGVRDFYEEAINQSERFGVSANEVIKNINNNLEKSQQFVFKDGSKGLAKMAMYATKFKMDMGSVFSAMEKSNSLEGSVDMAAQLQVIGGNFAKTDPFKLLYESRNDAEAFTKSMQGLTKGMYTFNRSTGELAINAGDMNRLKLAAEATGRPIEDLVKQAQKGTQIDMMSGLMGGLSKDAKEFIHGVAEIQKDGNFQVKLGNGEMADIRALSEGQVRALMSSNVALEARARDAQAFDEILTNTINEMKSGFLPILTALGDLTKWLSKTELLKPLMWVGVGMMGISAASGLLMKGATLYKELFGSASAGLFGKIFNRGKGTNVGALPNPTAPTVNNPASGAGGAGGKAGSMFSKTSALNMAAFGAAIALVGAGIWMATKGVAAMATAFKELDPKQLAHLNETLVTLGWTFGGLAVGIGIVGMVAGAAWAPMLAFGGAVALIGLGIGIAAAGLGYMAKGFGEMFESLSKITDPTVLLNLNALIFRLTALAGSLILFANPMAWIGLAMLGGTITEISNKLQTINFAGIANAGKSFETIATAIEKINERKLDKLIEVSKGLGTMGAIAAMFGNLGTMFGDGIEVKFPDDVNLRVDITNEIDGQALTRRLSRTIPVRMEADRRGE